MPRHEPRTDASRKESHAGTRSLQAGMATITTSAATKYNAVRLPNNLRHRPAPANLKKEVPQHHSESDDESRGSNINNAGLRGGDAAALQEVIESSPRSVYKRFPFRQDRPLKSTEQTPASAPKRTASAPEPPVSAPEPPTSAPEPRRTARVPKKKEFPDYIVDQSLSKRVRRV